MTVSDLRELFVHDLEDIYYAEQELLGVLSELADQTEDKRIAGAFREHREETKRHVERLEQVFDMLSEEPDTEECEGIEGLIREHEEFADADPDRKVLELHNLIAGQKTEHYEIAAYGNLALIADRLGMDEAGDILHRNLEEEEKALETLSQFVDEYDYEAIKPAEAAD